MPIEPETLFVAQRARVYRWAYAMCRRSDQALDVVQEVFLRLMRSGPSLATEAAALAWLRRTTGRVMIDLWRSQTSRRALESNARDAATAGVTDPIDEDVVAQLREAIQSLSEQQRLVLIGKCLDGMTFAQIAAEIGVAIPTAKTHYLRALEALRGRLGAALVLE